MSPIQQRTTTYIIGKPSIIPADATDVSLDELFDEITQLGEDEFNALSAEGEDTTSCSRVVSKLTSEQGELDALVVEMTDESKESLDKKYKNSLLIEEDEPLFHGDFGMEPEIPMMQNMNMSADTEKLTLKVIVKDLQDKPVFNARVTISGLLWVESGFTDKKGKVKLTLIDETKESISSIEIKPSDTFWSLNIIKPAVSDTEENEIILNEISPSFGTGDMANKNQYIGWGQRDMKLDIQAPISNNDNTKRVRIAVIDSGLTSKHPDLSPTEGFDFGDTTQPKKTWKKDGSGHGTHVSGICTAQDNELGILGFAPGAELIVLRVFPNASNSKLMNALNWCIDNNVDVINMSLGGKKASQLVRQRIQACRENGILPIAAAGNNGGDVLYPAAFEEVLAVAAIGRFDSFPQDSSHQKQIGGTPIQSGDYFSPRFTCRGPQIDVCAPGVAIVSSVPDKGYAAWDGTSMACPHVAGFAARLLQLHTDIFNQEMNSARSQKLFDTVLNHCKYLEGIPSIMQGKGMPILSMVTPHISANDGNINDDYIKKVAKLVDEAIQIVKVQLN